MFSEWFERKIYGSHKDLTSAAINRLLYALGFSAACITINVAINKIMDGEVSFFAKYAFDGPIRAIMLIVSRIYGVISPESTLDLAINILSLSTLFGVAICAIGPLAVVIGKAMAHDGFKGVRLAIKTVNLALAVNWLLLVSLFVSGAC